MEIKGKRVYQLLFLILFSVAFTQKDKNKKTLKKDFKNRIIIGCYADLEARCTGSAYCKACKNCSSCKYCSNGGSCGICSGGYRAPRKKRKTKIYYKTKKSTKRNIYDGRTNNVLTIRQQLKEEPLYSKILLVNKENLSLRSGESITNYEIQKLRKGEKLFLLAMHGEWIKVKVKRTETIGFVYYKHVVLVND